MLKHFDDVTVAVTDPAAAIGFFALLGFELDKDVVINGPVMDQYMGIAGLEARHVTLSLGGPAAARGAAPAFPEAAGESKGDIARLDRIGFNHVCFAVSDIDFLIAKVTAAGVRLRNQPMIFHDRKLVFLEGLEGITVELAEWK